jgi:hypothetical protein
MVHFIESQCTKINRTSVRYIMVIDKSNNINGMRTMNCFLKAELVIGCELC